MEDHDHWEVYIIQDSFGKLYTGITNNLERRFLEHQTGKRGAKFFRLASPEKILFREKHSNRSEASKREAAIKKLKRSEKNALISGEKGGEKNYPSIFISNPFDS